MAVELPDGWDECERGNTWLVNEDGAHVAYFDLPVSGRRLEVTVTPTNYPGFNLTLLDKEKSSDAVLAGHITKLLERGWTVRKCNIPGVSIPDDE